LLTLHSLIASTAEVVFKTPPYNSVDSTYQYQQGPIVLSKMPPLRNQGDAGHCFAFSTASAIDHFLCSEKNSHFDFNDLCLKNLPIVSSLQLTSLSTGSKERVIVEGGFASGILLTIGQVDPYLILETCAPYEKYLNYLDQYTNQKQGPESLFQTVERIYNGQLAQHYSCGTEFARVLANHTLNMDTDQIMSFSRGHYNSFGELLYNTMIPRRCHGSDKMIHVFQEIDFDSRQGTQFLFQSQIDYDYFYKTVTEQISQDIPVIINFFTGASDAEIDRIHSALITGIQQCKQKKECKTLFKIQNSYGDWWQSQYNGGWVQADPLIERSVYTDLSLVWTKKK